MRRGHPWRRCAVVVAAVAAGSAAGAARRARSRRDAGHADRGDGRCAHARLLGRGRPRTRRAASSTRWPTDWPIASEPRTGDRARCPSADLERRASPAPTSRSAQLHADDGAERPSTSRRPTSRRRPACSSAPAPTSRRGDRARAALGRARAGTTLDGRSSTTRSGPMRRPLEVDDRPKRLEALRDGARDAVMLDLPTALAYARGRGRGRFAVAGAALRAGGLAAALPQGLDNVEAVELGDPRAGRGRRRSTSCARALARAPRDPRGAPTTIPLLRTDRDAGARSLDLHCAGRQRVGVPRAVRRGDHRPGARCSARASPA